MKQSYKTFLLWILLILMFLGIYSFFMESPQTKEVSFTSFIKDMRSNRILEVTIKGNEFTFTKQGKDGIPRRYTTVGIIGEELNKELIDRGIQVTYQKEDQDSVWLTIFVQWLPIVFLFLIFFFFMRQLQIGGGKAMSFGKSRARLLSESHKKVTFADVAGIDEAKDELEEIIEFLKDPKKFTKLGGRIPKGVLLMGPPGTGKTLLARAIAGEAGVPFFSISGSDFVEMFVGVGASRVRDLFEQGKKNAPCLIFIDEIDAVGRHRGAGLGGGHDEREQTLNQLLVEMDGFESNEGVIIISATNRPDVLDPALLRPGRFDRRIVITWPDLKGREAILNVHTKNTPLADDVDLSVIARGTPGFAGADLENLVNEAALLAARQNKDKVFMADFETAKDKILMGIERKTILISDKERETTAYHEAGHALVARLLPGTDPVHKVTIIPRGRALGITQQLPTEDRWNVSKSFALNQLRILMGGRVAEEIIFNQQTTGAGNDFEVATELARKMVCEWGMSEKIGPLAFKKKEEAIFIGREIAQHQEYSEQTAIEIDAEVRRFVMESYNFVHKLLLEHINTLKRLAEALLEYEVLDGAEVDLIIQGKKITRKAEAKANAKVKETKKQEKVKEKKKLWLPQPQEVGEG